MLLIISSPENSYLAVEAIEKISTIRTMVFSLYEKNICTLTEYEKEVFHKTKNEILDFQNYISIRLGKAKYSSELTIEEKEKKKEYREGINEMQNRMRDFYMNNIVSMEKEIINVKN